MKKRNLGENTQKMQTVMIFRKWNYGWFLYSSIGLTKSLKFSTLSREYYR